MRTYISPLVESLATAAPYTLQNRLLGTFIPVFILHRMACPDLGLEGHCPKQLEEFLGLLRKKGFNFISLEQAALHLSEESRPPPRSIALTFDDGFFDHYSIAAPILNRYDCPATFFLITDFIHQKLWPWDDQVAYMISSTTKESICWPPHNGTVYPLSTGTKKAHARRAIIEQFKTSPNQDLYQELTRLYTEAGVSQPEFIPEKYRPMNWNEARQLAASGHTIAAHTKTHRILSQLDEDSSKQEIRESIKEVRKQVGRTNAFAYPTGRAQDFGDREIETLRECGINHAVSTIPLTARAPLSDKGLYRISRLSMPKNRFDLLQYASWIEAFKGQFR